MNISIAVEGEVDPAEFTAALRAAIADVEEFPDLYAEMKVGDAHVQVSDADNVTVFRSE